MSQQFHDLQHILFVVVKNGLAGRCSRVSSVVYLIREAGLYWAEVQNRGLGRPDFRPQQEG